MMTATKAIPLDQAPEHFFDQEKWHAFLALYTSRESAISDLTCLGPRITRFDRYDPNSKESRQQRLREEILKDFVEKLACGDVVAWAIQPPSKKIELVPPAIWSHLSLNFMNNTARGGKYEFIGIQVFAAKDGVASGADTQKSKKTAYQADRIKEWALAQKNIPASASKSILNQIEIELKFRPDPKTAKKGFKLAREARLAGK
jgi:hypothetical protein